MPEMPDRPKFIPQREASNPSPLRRRGGHPQPRPENIVLPPEKRDAIAIALTQGKVAVISKEDVQLAEHTWRYTESRTRGKVRGYAVRNLIVEEKLKIIYLHREIMETILQRPLRKEEYVEHINGDTLDNRRDNLLYVTWSERNQRRKLRNDNDSGYKGVIYKRNKGLWQAQITVNGEYKYLGLYSTPEQAAQAYNEAALMYFGEVAKLNEIPSPDQPKGK